ncbi:MAG: hypothetical protein WCT39_02050 [Candidatus Margulisiibacteriota bacterium]
MNGISGISESLNSTRTQVLSAGGGGSDFRDLMSSLMNKTTALVRDYAAGGEITIEGFGTMDTDDLAASIAINQKMSDSSNQMNTLLSYLTYAYKTFPQMLQQAFSA